MSNPLLRYLIVTFGVTWACWVPVTFATYGLPSFAEPYPSRWFGDIWLGRETGISHWLIIAGGFLGPLLGALAAWHARSRSRGIRTLFRHLRPASGGSKRWWLLGLIPIGYFGLLTLTMFMIGGVGTKLGYGAGTFFYLLLVGSLMIAGEELGWRGTQQPMLQEKRSALWSAVLVGICWAYWHIPLFLMSFSPGDGSGFAQAAVMTALSPLSTIPAAILLAGVFNSVRGFLLVPILFHGLNNSLNSGLEPVGDPATIASLGNYAAPMFLGVLWVLAIASWAVFGKESLSRGSKQTASRMLEH